MSVSNTSKSRAFAHSSTDARTRCAACDRQNAFVREPQRNGSKRRATPKIAKS
jgi:hypothetical protein